MKWYRSLPLWFGLLSISLLVHLLLSWRASLSVNAGGAPGEDNHGSVDIPPGGKTPPPKERGF